MAEQGTGGDTAARPGGAAVESGGDTAARPGGAAVESGGAALLAFDRVAVVGQAIRVREAGAEAAECSADLVAALEEASAAASGMAAAVPGGLISGPALAECAALLARRARDCAAETGRIAEGMTRAVGLLAEADEEVARGVADAAG